MTDKTKKYISELEVTSEIVSDSKLGSQLVIRKPTLKRKIIQNIHKEEDYLEHIDKIIQRDFYPDLAELRSTSDYLEAIDKNDAAKVLSLERQYLNRHGTGGILQQYSASTFSTPSNFDTPKPKDRIDSMQFSKQERPTHNPRKSEASDLTLDNYLSSNTSEDNASFCQLLEEAERKRRDRMYWCYEKAAEMASRAIEANDAMPRPLAIMPKENSRTVSSQNGSSCNANDDPESIEEDNGGDEKKSLTLEVAKDAVVDSKSLLTSYLEARPSVPRSDNVETWPTYKVHNSVMFPPEGSPLSSEELIDMSTKQRSILHENTRFKRPVGTIQDALSRQKMSLNSANSAKLIGRFGPDGKEIRPDSTPRMGGFSFVSHTPSPRPGEGNETPGMTWGEIESTPFRISTGDTPRIGDSSRLTDNLPSFTMADISDREKIGLELTERLKREKREKKDLAVNKIKSHLISPSSSSRLPNLSPAAQRLLSSKLQRMSSIDMDLRASYTPSPARRLGSSAHKRTTSSLIKNARGTPVSSRPVTPGSTPLGKSITDNLLNL